MSEKGRWNLCPWFCLQLCAIAQWEDIVSVGKEDASVAQLDARDGSVRRMHTLGLRSVPRLSLFCICVISILYNFTAFNSYYMIC